MKLSRDGYKRNSKDVNNPYNVIPSGDITMKGVDFPVMGTDNLGNQQVMQPGFDYKFPGNMVFEQPVQDKPKNQVKQRRVDRDNKLMPNWTKEMGDVSSHLMTTMQFTDDDGSPIYIAIPTLFPTTEGQETPDPASWTQFAKGDEMSAFEMAMERGEVYYFSSAEEANAFAKGGYKTPNLKKRDGGSLPKAQLQLIDDAYQWGKSLFSKPTIGLQYPTGGLTHKFTNAPKFPIEGRASDHFGLLKNFDYTSFPDWQRYIAASQPLSSSYQFPTLVNDAAFNNLVNNKNLINVNLLSQYLDKTKGLNSTQLYDRQRIKSAFNDLNLQQKYVDKDLFLEEVNKTLNPQLTIPSLTSLPMKTGTDYADYWMGKGNPHKTFSFMANREEFTPTNWDNMSAESQKKWIEENYPDLSSTIVKPNTDPHVLQTFIPNSPGVPMWDRSVGSSHFNPMVNDSYEGGLTLGHNRISFDPAFPKTTVSLERQSDYAQRYNVKSRSGSGLGAFDEYMNTLKDTKPLQTELAIERSKTNLDNTTKFIEEIDKGDDAIRKLLHSEAQVEHWTGRTFHEAVKNFYNGRDFRPRFTARGPDMQSIDMNKSNYKINNNDVSFDATYLNFNDLTHDQIIEIVNLPQFRNYIKENKKYFKSEYDENIIKHKEQVAKNEKEIYDIENWSPLKTNLERYKKNAPTILLNELIDYSTKIGNTHVHLPLSSTVAKTQGYDANKWGAPNPLFHQFKWTGHDWNSFNNDINDLRKIMKLDLTEGNTKSIGPFSFKVIKGEPLLSTPSQNHPNEIITIYKNPETGEVTEFLGTAQEQMKQMETIRNEFLTSKGYNPEVDYKNVEGAYKPEHQTILNKSSETQLKKDIEQIFGKGYPYEIITDGRGNQYIRLDHTGTRLPIKNIHEYKSGGESLPKAQWWNPKNAYNAFKTMKNSFSPGIKPMNVRKVGDFGKPRSQYIFQAPHGDRVQSLKNYYNPDFTKFSELRTHPNVGDYTYDKMIDEFTWLNDAAKVSDRVIKPYNPIYDESGDLISYDMPNLRDYVSAGYVVNNKTIFELDPIFGEDLTSEISKLNASGFIHGDLHSGNIMVKLNASKNKVLDFKIIDPSGFPQLTSDINYKTAPFLQSRQKSWNIDKTDNPLFQRMNVLNKASDIDKKKLIELENKKPIEFADYQQGGSLPKAQDGKEVKDYFTAYLNSDLFKRRAIDLHGEENWEKVRDGKLKRLGDTEVDFSGEEEWADIYATDYSQSNLLAVIGLKEKFDRLQSRYMRPGYDGNTNPIVKVNPGQAVTMAEDHELSYNPFNSILTNEYSHALGANHPNTNDTAAIDFLMTERERDMTKEKGRDFLWSDNDLQIPHDTKSYEIKSDIDTTRYELWKAGLYDFEEDFMFDQSHIDYIRENPDKFIKDKQLLEQFDDNQVVDMMNTFTDNSSMPLGMSKYGGQLPKAQTGVLFPADNTGSGFPGGNYNYFNPLDFKQTFNTDVPIAWEDVPQDVKDKWEGGREFMQMWYTSPMGIQMMKNSDPENWEQLQAARLENINKDYSDINFYYNNINDPTLWAWAGGKHGTHNIGVYPRAFYAGPSAAHEFTHISHNENTWKDRFKDTHWDTDVLGEIPINKSFFKSYGPESNWFNPMQEGLAAGNYQGFGDFGGHTYKWDKEKDEFLLIPQTDMNLMYASDLSYNDHRGPHSRLGNIEQSDSEYWGEASEHIARLNAIRYKAYHTRDEHGWDPLTMPLTAELWEKVKKVIPSVGGDDDFNAIEQLGSIIGDNATRKHLNLISDASDQTGNGNMKTAKFGGQLPKAQLQLINEGEKLINYGANIVNKGKQIIPRLKKAYDLNKYNKSTDIFGNSGYDLAADLTPSILKNRSLIDFKSLENTTVNEDRLHQLMADYTIDSGPFKFGTFKDIDGNTLENLVQPLSVIKGPNGEVINATDNKFALELSDYIKNNRLNWKNSTDGELNKSLSLTRMWNENESISGTHGNINDLKLSLESGEPIQLGDITSWSAGKAGLNAFGQHRYVIKDFDLETPALLNEYNKYLSKNQQNVWKEREILLGPDTKFTVKNIIDNAPRKPGWDLYTNLKESNPKLWEELNLDFGSTNKAGGYGFTNDPTLKVWPNGQTNPNYDKIQTLIQNDPTFKVKATPNYGTDIELELLKKLYGGSLNSLPKAQIQDEILNANIKADKWNKEYVQSENYMSMLKRAKEKESVINSRIAEAMNFDPYKHITYDENNYSLGQYYNSGSHSSDGSQYPISTFMHGEAMLNYNPTLFPNHPAYNNSGISTGGWPALAGHELIGHYGVDKLNRKQRKALNSLINWEALDNFAGDSNEAYDHGKDPYEMRANLAQLRYQLDNAGIYDSKKGLAVTADGEEGDNPFTEEHLKQILEFDEDGTFIRIKPEFNNEILQFVAPQDIIWMMNNIAQNQEIGDDLPEGIIRAKMGAELTKFQEKGANDPNWLAQRLYNSVTPIGYNIDHALKEMFHGSRQPFMWDGVETSFDDFQNHPRFQEQAMFPGQGDYIKNASQDLWGMYLGFDQKNNTVSKSKFKPTKGAEDEDAIYYSFNDVRDIWADIIDGKITGTNIIDDITKDKWQMHDSGAGGFNLASYQISRGEDREKELPYYSYYDEYDFDIPTGLGFSMPGETLVGNPFEIYGRIYYNPETMEMIPENEVKGWWVDFEKLKQGVGYAESLDGELMINPESTATGRYGQRFSEINNVYEGTRTQFANDLEAQEKYFEDRYRGRMEGIPGLKESAIDLYQEYNKQIESFPYSTTEVAALVNFLGRQGTREYLGYVLRDGNSLESVFPDKYGPNAGQSNKTPQQYIDKFNEGITNMKKQHVEDDLTGRLIRKLDRGEKLTPAGTKHLESLGMI